jgi:hypothetical protein
MPNDPGKLQSQSLDTTGSTGSADSTGNGSAENSSGLFHSYTDGDGKKYDWKSADELNKFLNEGYMRDKDYRKKTMSHAEVVKKHEAERLTFDNDRKAFYEQKAKYDEIMNKAKQFDELFTRHPEAFKEIQAKLKGGIEPEGMKKIVAEYLKEQGIDPEEIKREREARQQLENRNQIFAALKEKYEDFDEQAVGENYDRLLSGSMDDFIEELYYANKGRLTPAQIEERLLKSKEKKEKAPLVSSSGSTSIKQKIPTNFRELRKQAKEYHGVSE